MQDTLIQNASKWLQQGKNIAFATVVQTWGSSPRPVGSQLLVSADGEFEGSVSGGCIEGAVVREAMEVIKEKKPRTLDYGVSDEQAWEVGLSCGGQVKVHITHIDRTETLDALIQNKPAAWVFLLDQNKDCLVLSQACDGNLTLTNDLLDQVQHAIKLDQSTCIETEEGTAFALVINPAQRLIIVGAVHIAQVMATLATAVGFTVTIIDPRRSFATTERMPDVELIDDWPDEALERLAPDESTAIITLTHDPKLDDPALELAIRSPAFHIGALGSRRTHAKRVERLKERGFSDAEISRIQGPVGLDIGARLPPEIALSIVAEIIAAKHNRLPESA